MIRNVAIGDVPPMKETGSVRMPSHHSSRYSDRAKKAGSTVSDDSASSIISQPESRHYRSSDKDIEPTVEKKK